MLFRSVDGREPFGQIALHARHDFDAGAAADLVEPPQGVLKSPLRARVDRHDDRLEARIDHFLHFPDGDLTVGQLTFIHGMRVSGQLAGGLGMLEHGGGFAGARDPVRRTTDSRPGSAG